MTKNKYQKITYIPMYLCDTIWNCQISRPILDLDEDELNEISELAYRACELKIY